jgi:RNA-directed DNA polymerase
LTVLKGWRAYFSYGTVARAHAAVDWYVADRARHFLRRRHKVRSRGTRDFPTEHVFGERGVVKLYRKRGIRATPRARRGANSSKRRSAG